MRIDDRRRHETLNRRINAKGNYDIDNFADSYGRAKEDRSNKKIYDDFDFVKRPYNDDLLTRKGSKINERYGHYVSKSDLRKANIKRGNEVEADEEAGKFASENESFTPVKRIRIDRPDYDYVIKTNRNFIGQDELKKSSEIIDKLNATLKKYL